MATPLTHLDPEPLRELRGGRTHRRMVADQQEGPAVADPAADGLALIVGERGLLRAGAPHSLGPEGVGDDQDGPFVQRRPGELLAVRDDLIAVAGDQVGERLVTASGRVEVVVGLIEEDPRMSLRVRRAGDLGIEIGVSALTERPRPHRQELDRSLRIVPRRPEFLRVEPGAEHLLVLHALGVG